MIGQVGTITVLYEASLETTVRFSHCSSTGVARLMPTGIRLQFDINLTDKPSNCTEFDKVLVLSVFGRLQFLESVSLSSEFIIFLSGNHLETSFHHRQLPNPFRLLAIA